MGRMGIKTVIKTVAVALIILPEPFTTALGVIVLCVTLALFRQKSLHKFGDLEVLIKRSVQKTKPVGFRAYLGTEKEPVTQFYRLSLHSQPLKASGKLNRPLTVPQYNRWFDNRKVTEKVLHHTLKTSFPQYEASQGSYSKEYNHF